MNLKELASIFPEIFIAQSDIQFEPITQNLSHENYLKFLVKPNSKLTVYLKPDEFKNKTLTEFLKKILVNGLKVAPEFVSFAIVKNPFPSILLKNNPDNIAILFGDFLINKEQIPSNLKVCEIFALSDMIHNEEKKRIAWNKMKEVLSDIIKP